ncbi:FecR family protein [Flavitalea sp.]|nr:FecR domain-containing protein [Flavitalea sp.]
MNNNSNLDQLLTLYLLNESNAEQEAFVSQWINEDDANKDYLQELKKTIGLIGATRTSELIDINKEWDQFSKNIGNNQYQAEKTEVIGSWDESLNIADTAIRSKVYRIVAATAVAASLLLVVGFGWQYFNKQKTVERSVVVVDQLPVVVKPILRTEINNEDKPRVLKLSDGSGVILEGKSELAFYEPFASDTRNVTLKGKANFIVVKDQKRPFTVFSSDIKTTVLGTNFTVTAYSNSQHITVRLFEGRVKVSSGDEVKKHLNKDFILSPGQELIYDKKKSTASVRNFGVAKQSPKGTNKNTGKEAMENPSIPFDKGSWYMFNNELLSQVFDQLKSMYKVDIRYDAKDLEKVYFIGMFKKTEAIDDVLKQIAKLNNLTVTKKDNKYIISKL